MTQTRIIESRVTIPRYNITERKNVSGNDGYIFTASLMVGFGTGYAWLGFNGISLMAWSSLVCGGLTIFNSVINTVLLFHLTGQVKTEEMKEYIQEDEEPALPQPLIINKGDKTIVSHGRADIRLPSGYKLTGANITALQATAFNEDGTIKDDGFSRERVLIALYGDASRDTVKDTEYRTIRKGLEDLGYVQKSGGGNHYKWSQSGLRWLCGFDCISPTPIGVSG